jgi:NTP pyrophosphatase (non-canonical NTP hydrolase)
MQIGEFQRNIEKTYYDRDSARGMGGTFMWFIEEVGELSTAVREGDKEAMKGEFADVLAWLCTVASLAGIRMEEAVQKYAHGCPQCHKMPCDCSHKS